MFVKTLRKVETQDVEAAGHEAADLASLERGGVPQEPSFVILSSAFAQLVQENNLKYKIDYLLSHTKSNDQASLMNAYNGVRRTLNSAKLPAQLEDELKELYESLTAQGVGLSKGKPHPTRIILSTNVRQDPENYDTVIQNIRDWKEFMVAVREAWALAYVPSILKKRMQTRYLNTNLRVALIVQAMNQPQLSVHAYSAMPQDHTKTYMQVYYGYPDLRNRITKDFYAINRNSLVVVDAQFKQQHNKLTHDSTGELVLTPISGKNDSDKINKRDRDEVSRLIRKSEKILQEPVKGLFTVKDGAVRLFHIARLGFDILEREPVDETEYQEIAVPETNEPQEDEYREIPLPEEYRELIPEERTEQDPEIIEYREITIPEDEKEPSVQQSPEKYQEIIPEEDLYEEIAPEPEKITVQTPNVERNHNRPEREGYGETRIPEPADTTIITADEHTVAIHHEEKTPTQHIETDRGIARVEMPNEERVEKRLLETEVAVARESLKAKYTKVFNQKSNDMIEIIARFNKANTFGRPLKVQLLRSAFSGEQLSKEEKEEAIEELQFLTQ